MKWIARIPNTPLPLTALLTQTYENRLTRVQVGLRVRRVAVLAIARVHVLVVQLEAHVDRAHLHLRLRLELRLHTGVNHLSNQFSSCHPRRALAHAGGHLP